MSKNRIQQFAPRNEQNGSADETMQLKAHAYDVIAQIEALQNRLRQINARLAELAVPPPVSKHVPEPSGD